MTFDSVLNRPSISAYITVTLSEEASLCSHPWPGSPSASLDPIPTSLAPRYTSAATPLADPSYPWVHPSPSPGLPSLQVHADDVLSTEDPLPDTTVDDPEAYFGCPIEEEHPSPVHSN